MVDINQYFTEEEKIDILSDLINAEYRCGYTGNAISDIDIKKYRDNIIKSDSYEDKLKLADELLPTLKMKINLNKTSRVFHLSVFSQFSFGFKAGIKSS